MRPSDANVKAAKGGANSSLRNSPFIVVQEFQRGKNLRDICFKRQSAEWAQQVLGAKGALSVRGRERLRQIGKMVAFDVLVHNSDRWHLPEIFDSFSKCGNVANIMFDDDAQECFACPKWDEPFGHRCNTIASSGGFVAIDNSTNAFATTQLADNQAQHDTYQERVAALVRTTRARHAAPARAAGVGLSAPCHPAVQSVAGFFLHGQGRPTDDTHVPGMGYDVGDAGAREIERGFLEVTARLEQLGGARDTGQRARQLGAVFEGVEAIVKEELQWVTPDRRSLGLWRVSAEFFTKTALSMCEAATLP